MTQVVRRNFGVIAGSSGQRRAEWLAEAAATVGSGRDDADAQIRRLRQRHPDMDEALAAALVARCLRAKDDGYAIVARTLALGESQPQAAGRILEAHSWMELRNVETLCAQGFLAHL